MKQTFYSNGKLLITGEYVVLDGAKALALPTKFGQNLVVESIKEEKIIWKSFDADGSIWFEDTFTLSSIIRQEKSETNSKVKNTLIDILHEAFQLNPDFVLQSHGYRITTQLSFPKNWGLGTSSTLINNIAQWLQIDAFELLQLSFGGSGYDIACAKKDSPIVYELFEGKPKFKRVAFLPIFKEHIYFVYLNKKQSSKDAIQVYLNKQSTIGDAISKINSITETIIDTKDIKTFAHAVEKHEILMSNVLELETVKEKLFHDFNGVVKSLGAWGGDFVMVVSKENPESYFKEKGYAVVLPYHEMIL